MKYFKELYYWWYREGKYIHYNIVTFVKNLIKWFPLLWKDRDWDHVYIMDALKFKIQNTAIYINKHKRYVGYERDVEIMNLCVRLIDKINDEFYEMEYLDYYKSEFSWLDTEDSNLKKLHSTCIEDNLSEYFKKYSRSYLKYNAEKDNHITAILIGRDLHEKAKRILFTLLERNIEKWWD